MSYYSPKEQDPLLPKDEPSPEIQGSRPQSIYYDQGQEEHMNRDSKYAPPRTVLSQRQRSKANWLACVGGLFMLATVAVVFFPDQIFGDGRPVPKTIDQRVNRILEDTPLIDGHNDLAISITSQTLNKIYDESFRKPFEEGGMKGHVDLPRLKEGKNGGAFWSAFTPCPKNGSDFSTEKYAQTVAFTISQIDLLTRLQVAYPNHFALPGNSSTALAAFKSGLYISPFGIEGLHQIGNSISNLRLYYSLGVRYATLTHNCHNIYADAAITEVNGGIRAGPPLHGGVSSAGRHLIKEMNRIGMIVDLSHVSPDTMSDVLGGDPDWKGSLAPIIFSHSSAYSVCPHPRNVPDHILQLVKKTNSVVMINFAPDFISCVVPSNPADDWNGIPDFYPKNNTIQHVVTHIKYIGDLIGYEHVGLGSDFDGIPTTPEGLDDVSKFPDLVKEMLNRGVTDEQAGWVVGGNVLRVWGEVDRVALKLRKEGVLPLEDEIELKWGAMELDAFV